MVLNIIITLVGPRLRNKNWHMAWLRDIRWASVDIFNYLHILEYK